MTHICVMTLVNSPLAYGNLYGALNTRRSTLVQGFCLSWLFLMEGKGLKRCYDFFLLHLQSLMIKSFVIFCGLITFLYLNSSNLRPVKSFVDVVGF